MRSFSKSSRSTRPAQLLRPGRGFTVLEVLITLAILLVVLLAVTQFMGDVDRAWKSAASDPFADAENAFFTVTQNLAAATLEPYQDYANSSGAFYTGPAFVPDHLARRSDLDFVCGASAGTGGLLTGPRVPSMRNRSVNYRDGVLADVADTAS